MKTPQSKKESWSERSIFSLIILIVAAQGAAAQTNTFPASGNAGVGTTSPTQLLQINTSTSGGGLLLSNTASSAGTVTPIQFKFDVGATAEIKAIKPNAGTGLGTSINTDLSFRVWDSAVTGYWSEALYLKSNGNVGIGTTTPGTLNGVNFGPNVALHVKGTGTSKYLAVDDSTNVGFLLNDSSQSADSRIWVLLNQNSRLSLSAMSDAGLPSEKFTVLRNGNVGIGTNTPGGNLDVVGNINTSTQYNIGGNRVFSIAGTNNTFAGIGTGNSNTTGGSNAFFGHNAGNSNTTGSQNSFFGTVAGAANTTGAQNSFFGTSAGQGNTSGNSNAFFGSNAGRANTTGNGNNFFGNFTGLANTTGSNNSFFGDSAGRANTTGNNNAFFGVHAGTANTTASENSFFGNAAGQANTTGNQNAFFGDLAGSSNTTGGSNTFVGSDVGVANTTGFGNSFFGSEAGLNNTTGNNNAFFGWRTGLNNTTASNNAFFGWRAGAANTTGQGNSYFGTNAGADNTTGNRNVAIGVDAGTALKTGSNNIYLANVGADESNRIRIGSQGTQTVTFIAGISGTPVAGDAVFVDANGQLGVGAPSSRRFKQDIAAMGNASSKLMQLRPVVFHYRPEYVTGKPTLQYGLIAEEVARVYPELVGFGADGKPQTVRYHLLNTLLLNEVQKQKSHIQSQEQQLESQARQIADLEARLRRLELQPSTRRRRR